MSSAHTRSMVLDPAHVEELQEIWTLDKRMPTVKSRRAWATARNLGIKCVSHWFRLRQRVAKRAGIELPTDAYDLPVGTPPIILLSPEFDPIQGQKMASQPPQKKRKIEVVVKTENLDSDDTLFQAASDSSTPTLYAPSSDGPYVPNKKGISPAPTVKPTTTTRSTKPQCAYTPYKYYRTPSEKDDSRPKRLDAPSKPSSSTVQASSPDSPAISSDNVSSAPSPFNSTRSTLPSISERIHVPLTNDRSPSQKPKISNAPSDFSTPNISGNSSIPSQNPKISNAPSNFSTPNISDTSSGVPVVSSQTSVSFPSQASSIPTLATKPQPQKPYRHIRPKPKIKLVKPSPAAVDMKATPVSQKRRITKLKKSPIVPVEDAIPTCPCALCRPYPDDGATSESSSYPAPNGNFDNGPSLVLSFSDFTLLRDPYMSGRLDLIENDSTYDRNPPLDLVLPLKLSSASVVSSSLVGKNTSSAPGSASKINEIPIVPEFSADSKEDTAPLEESLSLLELPRINRSCTSTPKTLEVPPDSTLTRSLFPVSESSNTVDPMADINRTDSSKRGLHYTSLILDGNYYSYDGLLIASKVSTRPFAHLEEEEEEEENEEPTIECVPRSFQILVDEGKEEQRPFTHYELRGEGFGFLPIIPDPVVIPDVEEDEEEEEEEEIMPRDADEGWGMKLRSRVKR